METDENRNGNLCGSIVRITDGILPASTKPSDSEVPPQRLYTNGDELFARRSVIVDGAHAISKSIYLSKSEISLLTGRVCSFVRTCYDDSAITIASVTGASFRRRLSERDTSPGNNNKRNNSTRVSNEKANYYSAVSIRTVTGQCVREYGQKLLGRYGARRCDHNIRISFVRAPNHKPINRGRSLGRS